MVPAMGVSIFMLLTGGLKVYDLPYGLTSGGPGYSTYTVTQSIILTGIGSSRYGLAPHWASSSSSAARCWSPCSR